MRLIRYLNQRTAVTLQGVPGSTANNLIIRAESLHQPPDIIPGDVIALADHREQQVFVLAVDRTGLSLRGHLSHLRVTTATITGKGTVTRQATATDDFGRPTATLVTVVTDTPTALVDSREVYPDPAPAGGPQLIIRHELLVAADVPIRTGDALTYSSGGSSQEYRVVGSVPAGPGLWRVYCVD